MSFVKALIGVLLIGWGGLLLLFGLFRLGWRRHGTSPVDFRFLHLDWIVQPELPYWFAHMQNLALAVAGMVVILGGAVMILQLVRELLRRLLRPGHAQ